MAAAVPGSTKEEDHSDELEETLMSMESLERESPELWPEKFPGMNDFMSSYTPTPSKQPYSKEFSQEDTNYLNQLATLPLGSLISKVKELHDIAYQLGVEESKEVTRGKYLKIFEKRAESPPKSNANESPS